MWNPGSIQADDNPVINFSRTGFQAKFFKFTTICTLPWLLDYGSLTHWNCNQLLLKFLPHLVPSSRCALLHYFPEFIIVCGDTELKQQKTVLHPSWCCSSSIVTENTTGNTTRKPDFMYFSVPQVNFLCAWKSHCSIEMWLPRGWSPLEFIRTSAVSYDAAFDVKDKTRVCLVFGGRGFTYNEDSQSCSARNPALKSLSLWN